MPKLKIEQTGRDSTIIEGTEYANEIFRTFGVNLLTTGQVFRVDEKKDGTVTITRLPHYEND
jgi:hypothetical protein